MRGRRDPLERTGAPKLEPGSTLRVRPARAGLPERTFKICGLRAKGGQGYIYALSSDNGDPAVLKVATASGRVSSEVERRILQELPAHPNIVPLIGTAVVNGTECPVLPWAYENPYLRLNQGTLEDATRPFRGLAPRTALPATTAIELIHELLLALEHMHRLGFVHGDIKSSNVLVFMDSLKHSMSNEDYFSALERRRYSTVLVDFGSTRSTAFLESMDARDERVVPSEFTPLYAPPEIFKEVSGDRGGKYVDVYQAGILLYQWVSGHPPYDTVLPARALQGYCHELVDTKKREHKGRVRPFDERRLRSARMHDVVFAEAFATQKHKDEFVRNALEVVDLATLPNPKDRPTISDLRQQVIKRFELESKDDGKDGLRVSLWNPRWHLTRENRFSEAAKVPDNPGKSGRSRRRSRNADQPTASLASPASEAPSPSDAAELSTHSDPEPQNPPPASSPAQDPSSSGAAARRSPSSESSSRHPRVEASSSGRMPRAETRSGARSGTSSGSSSGTSSGERPPYDGLDGPRAPRRQPPPPQPRPSVSPPTEAAASGRLERAQPGRGESARFERSRVLDTASGARPGTGRLGRPGSGRSGRPGSGRQGSGQQGSGRQGSGRQGSGRPGSDRHGSGVHDALDATTSGRRRRAAPPPPPSRPARPAAQAGKRVALVDDDRLALTILGRALKRRGFLVKTFQEPREALEDLTADPPDAVIVDLEMRGLSGLALIKELRERLGAKTFAVVVLSSIEDEQAIKDAYREGASDYLVKPVTEGELAVKLDQAIERLRAELSFGELPRELDGFELLEELYRGEVATVYRVADQQQRFPDVLKAIKVLRPDLQGQAAPVLQLRREIDTLALCEHPSITMMHASGLVGELLYYVTDEPAPTTLGDWVRAQGRLSVMATVDLVSQLASALHHLHERCGVILGSLTPHTVRYAGARATICELGHSIVWGGVRRGDLPELPMSRYVAGEWFDASTPPDPRVDLYSLGVLAIEAYSGRVLHAGPDGGFPEAPEWVRGLPPSMEQMLLRLVDPSPNRRFPSASSVLDVLAALG